MTYPPQGTGPQGNPGPAPHPDPALSGQPPYEAPQPPYEPPSAVGGAAWGQPPADYVPEPQGGPDAPHQTGGTGLSAAQPMGGPQGASEFQQSATYAAGGASMAKRPPAPGVFEAPGDGRNIGELVSDLTQKFSALMQQEVALAKAEAQQEAKKAGKGGGMLAGAGVAGFFAILFLSLAIWWALAVLIGSYEHPELGWSGLIMMILWGIVAGVLAMLGRNELKRIRALPETTNSVSKIPEALKGNEEMNR